MAGFLQDNVKGITTADTASLLEDVEGEWKAALGQSLNVASSTPQGIMISAEASARAGVMRNSAELANQLNPEVSGDIFLDSICALMDIQRVRDKLTKFDNIRMSGTPDTVISAGSRCRLPSGALAALTTSTMIPSSGEVLVTFQSVDPGDYAAGSAGTVWPIIDGVIGWGSTTVTAATATTAGSVRQSDTALRMTRRRRLGRQGRNSVHATIALLDEVNGLRSAAVRENRTHAAAVIDGVNFPSGPAIWVCADGGVDEDVAKAILEAAVVESVAGSNNGAVVNVNVLDTISGQTYPITFTRPANIRVWVRAVVRQNQSVSDPVQACTDAILAWAAGEQPNEVGLVTGAEVTAFELAGAINVGVPGITVRQCEVSSDGNTWAAAVSIALWHKATLARGDISVVLE